MRVLLDPRRDSAVLRRVRDTYQSTPSAPGYRRVGKAIRKTKMLMKSPSRVISSIE
jgi:hypothetical protein